jgi:choline-sulfatase
VESMALSHLRRGRGLPSALLALPLAFALACGSDAPAQRPRAVVLITLDTVRGDLFDWSDPHTFPAIKRFFADGLRFEQAVTVSPVTGPAHATIFTGLDPIRHRVLSNLVPLREDATTLAERMQVLGYTTAAFVSCSVLERGRGFEQGFDHYDADLARLYAPGHHERPADLTTDRALAWLRSHDTEPFFLWVHYFDAHAPYDPPPADRPRGFAELEARPELRPSLPQLRRLHRAGTPPPPRTVAYYRALYAGEVAFVDRQIGRLADYLASRPYFDRSVVVLTGDHGEELADHGAFFQHNLSLYDGVMRVPLAIRYAGAEARRVADQVTHGSIVATLLDLLGEPIPTGIHPSLMIADGSASGGQVMVKEPHFAVRPWGAALRAPPWKYVYWEDGSEELYDLGDDPKETRNVASSEPARVSRLRARVEDHLLPALGSRMTPQLDRHTRDALRALGYVD